MDHLDYETAELATPVQKKNVLEALLGKKSSMEVAIVRGAVLKMFPNLAATFLKADGPALELSSDGKQRLEEASGLLLLNAFV